MKLTIGIPVYNGKRVLRECLDSIFDNVKDLDFEVIVCDDGSTDGTAEMVQEEFPQVELIKNPKNFGVSRSMNRILKKVRQRRMEKEEYFLRLDADTKVLPGSVEGLIEFLEKYPRAGIVAPAIIDANGNLQRNYQERLQTPIWWFKEYALWVNKGLRVLRRVILSEAKGPDVNIQTQWDSSPLATLGVGMTNGVKQVAVLGSAAILVRREVFEKVNFDENLPFFMEDADFTMRVKNAGWEVWYYPGVSIQHLGGHSDEKIYIHCRDRSLQSLYYFTQKHFPRRWNQAVLTFSILFGSAISLFLAVIVWLPSRLHSRTKVIVNRAIRSFGNVFRWHGRRLKFLISNF